MSLALLPAELLDTIFAPLAPATLAALACTSTSLYPSATRLLYRHLTLSSYARNLSALNTLATRSHLCLLVRSFSISLDEHLEESSSAFPALLGAAVRGMTNLSSLELQADPGHSGLLAPAATSEYPNLEHFACSFPLDVHVARFLERSPALLSLQLGPSPDSAELGSTTIPRLTTYTGPPSLLGTLLPSRPIASLFLSGDLALSHVELLRLAKPSGAPTTPTLKLPHAAHGAHDALPVNATIKTLSAITSAPPVAVIEALANACPHLVSLRLITTCAFWETPDMVRSSRRS